MTKSQKGEKLAEFLSAIDKTGKLCIIHIMKIKLIAGLIFFTFGVVISNAEDFRTSSVAGTKHEALVKVHQKLPHNARIKRIYYSGSGNLNYCFVVYEKIKANNSR